MVLTFQMSTNYLYKSGHLILLISLGKRFVKIFFIYHLSHKQAEFTFARLTHLFITANMYLKHNFYSFLFVYSGPFYWTYDTVQF